MKKIFFALAATSLLSSPAFAKTWEVKMLNKAPDNAKAHMVFSPNFLKVEKGDTVVFKAVDKGHNSVSIKGMVPEGFAGWKGKVSKDVEVTFDKEGLYGYKCVPHTAMGMVGLIQVGEDSSNLEAAKAAIVPGKAKKVFADLFAKVEGQ